MQVGVVVAVVGIASEAYVSKAVGCTDTVFLDLNEFWQIPVLGASPSNLVMN